MGHKIAILTGPTAAGKTAFALELARTAGAKENIEIINADSMLVYRGMDIGTAKPTQSELTDVRHHLIDIREPDQAFNAGDFVAEVEGALRDIAARGHRALIVGGTGFYLKALLHGLWDAPKATPEIRAQIETRTSDELYQKLNAADPESALRIGVNDRYRLIRAIEILEMSGKTPTELQKASEGRRDPRFELWVVDRDANELRDRIAQRTDLMLQGGFVDEVKRLLDRFPESRALQAVGYAEAVRFLKGETPAGRKVRPGLDGLRDEIVLGTQQLVKRQRTWFRGQTEAQWFVLDGDREKLKKAFEALYS